MSASRRSYQFGPYPLQLDRRLLLRDGLPVALAPKALETLRALTEQRGRALTKDELLQRVWGDMGIIKSMLSRPRRALARRRKVRPIPRRPTSRRRVNAAFAVPRALEPDERIVARGRDQEGQRS